MKRRWMWSAWGILFAAIVVRLGFADIVVVDNNAMAPTILPGEWVWVWKRGEAAVGRVVFFVVPEGQLRTVKRVVGASGQTVEVHNGRLLVDGAVARTGDRRAAEIAGSGCRPSTVSLERERWGPATGWVVPGGGGRVTRLDNAEFYVLGDHRPASSDSRQWGPITRAQIGGTASRVIWSWDACAGKVRLSRLFRQID